MTSSIFRRIDIIILALIAFISAGLAVADFFHVLDLSWFGQNLSPLTLLLVSMIGLHLIVTQATHEEQERSTARLLGRIAQSTGAEFKYRAFRDAAELETYLGKRILQARESVCDLTWKAAVGPGFSATDRQVAHSFLDRSIGEASGRITYQEIFVFSDPSRLEKLERRLAENKSGYSCRYFRLDEPIPRLQFVIVDDEEVFFFASSAGAPLALFRSADLARAFRAFFDVTWSKARPIKDGSKVDQGELAYIHKFTKPNDGQTAS